MARRAARADLCDTARGGGAFARWFHRRPVPVDHGDRLAGLVLVDVGGLVCALRPPPPVLLALIRHGARPSERTALGLLRKVSFDVERARQRMGERWEPFLAYFVELSRTPSVRRANRRMLRELGFPRIPP